MNVVSSATNTVPETGVSKELSLMDITNFSIQNIVLPNFSLNSLNISDLILDTFDKVVAPTFVGTSPLDIQIKIHVTRHLLIQNLPRVLDPILPILSQMSISDLINLVNYSLQLSGISI